MLFKIVAILTLGWCLNLLIVDEKEPKEIFDSLEESYINIYIEYKILEELIKIEYEIDRDTIIIDLSSNIQSHFWISQLASRQRILHIINDDFNKGYSTWTFSLKPYPDRYINSLVNVLKNFNWSSGIVFLSDKNSWMKEKISKIFDNDFHYIIVESKTDISQVIDREVFRLGSYLYYLFTESNISEDIIQNLIRTNLLLKDSGILLSQESSYNTNFNGALILASKGQENTKSYEQETVQSLKNLFSQMFAAQNFNNTGNDINFIMKDILMSICESHFCANSFNLVNIQSGNRVIIGDSLSFSINDSIIFPCNSLLIPEPCKKIIKVSISNGSINPTTPPMPFTHTNYYGCYTAINQINTGQDLIENFMLSPSTFDCGVSEYNSTFMYNCFSKKFDDIGVMHFPSSFTPVVSGTMLTLPKLNHSIPLIAGMSNDDVLTLPQKYPFFSRTSFDYVYVAAQFIKVLYTMGWKNCAVLYQVEPLYTAMYQQFVETAEKYNMNILNREYLRAIPGDVNNYEALLNHTEIVQEVINSNARLLIMIMLADISIATMDLFYDLGLRNGDLIVLWAMPAWINTIYVPRSGGLAGYRRIWNLYPRT
ncbi:unnamed protein product [Blepharisma stoltei]|uniref:Receptor ligand binding region domain-containing protein n=1 Tax=Blepharisma stoltei TaxID=1481888 RepID=A0AAU9K3G1_9CILI|nr:unnamed protein product [Blepharisma stoltei]